MSNQENYEGIDFRVKTPSRAKSSISLTWWVVAGIAVVSLILLGSQLHDSHSQRRLIEELETAHKTDTAELKNSNVLNQRLRDQIIQLRNQVDQETKDLNDCKNSKASRRRTLNTP